MKTYILYPRAKGLFKSFLVITSFLFCLGLTAQVSPVPVDKNVRSIDPVVANSRFANQYMAIISEYNQDKLAQLQQRFAQKEAAERAEAEAYALANNLPIKRYNPDGSFDELQKLAEDGTPIYYTLHNVDAAISTRADYLNTGGGLGLNLNGDGMIAYVWDGGPTRPTHQEFDGSGGNNRVSIYDGQTSLNGNSFHAQHVTGTIVASGFVAAAKGMAWQADAETSDWNSDLTEATAAASGGRRAASTRTSPSPSTPTR